MEYSNTIETELQEDLLEAERCRKSEQWVNAIRADLERVASFDPRVPGTKFPDENKVYQYNKSEQNVHLEVTVMCSRL